MLHAHHARNIERYFQAIFVISFGKRTTIVKFRKISSTIVLRSFTIVKFRSTKFYEILRNFTIVTIVKFYDRKISYYDRRQPVENTLFFLHTWHSTVSLSAAHLKNFSAVTYQNRFSFTPNTRNTPPATSVACVVGSWFSC